MQKLWILSIDRDSYMDVLHFSNDELISLSAVNFKDWFEIASVSPEFVPLPHIKKSANNFRHLQPF